MVQVDTVSEKIKSFILKNFPLARNRRIHNNDRLLESGIVDSLGVLNLVSYVEQEFHISVSDDDLVPDNFQTIGHLTEFVRGKRNSGQE